MDNCDIENFRKILEENRKKEFDLMLNSSCDIKSFFTWFDSNAPWPHGTQKDFLNCLHAIWGEDVSKSALIKRYQRFHNALPQAKHNALRKAHNPLLDLIGYIYPQKSSVSTGILGNKIGSIVDKIFNEAIIAFEKRTIYHFTYLEISARGHWADKSFFHAQRYCLAFCGDIRTKDPKTPIFIVLAKSQCRKFEAVSCKKSPEILKMRRELLSRGIISDDGKFYVFNQDFIFKSPSMAASVLAGININGRAYWRDEDNRPLKSHREKNEFKITRGPGRPKKPS